MSQIKYYVNAKEPFRDNTAYVMRTGESRVCVLRDGGVSKPCKWGHWDQVFTERGDWIECTKDHAESLVKASATSASTTEDT